MRFFVFIATTLLAIQANSTTVGVVDSGYYMEHEQLKDHLWVNPDEEANRIDDDQNGLVDDIYGWNFAENNKYIFDISQVHSISEKTYKLMSIAAKMTGGIATEEEKNFIQENLIDLPVKERAQAIQELNFYGQYAHGTHVAGVVAENDQEAEIMNLRFFPASSSPVRGRSILDKIESGAFGLLAQLANQSFNSVGNYVAVKSAKVVNMSLGIPLERFARISLTIKGNREPTEEDIAKESKKIFKEFEAQALNWLSASEDTVFVVAAGNSSINNDDIPAFPANVDHENIISVGATIGYSQWPDFSNYGPQTVDVAAPGVAIKSSAPGPTDDFQVEMSGTSMAAPFVTGVCSAVASANPALTASDIKKIVLETVDVKPWLKDRVSTSGVVNKERAVYAATQSIDKTLEEALSEAKNSISDVKSTSSFRNRVELTADQKDVIYRALNFK